MMWFPRLLVAGSILAISAVRGAPPTSVVKTRGTGSCSSGEFEPVQYLGGNTNAICESNWGGNYLPVISLTVWGGSDFVTGIQATYSDNSKSQVYGNTNGRTASTISVNYGNGTVFNKLVLYGNAKGQYVRHIEIKNSAGDVLEPGYPQPVANGYSAFPQAVGSGILYGFQGSSDGTNVNGLGFLFLVSPVVEIDVTNFNFINPPQGSEDLTVTNLAQGHFYNAQSSGVYNWNFDNQKSFQVTHTFTQSSTDTYASMTGFTVGFNGGMLIPFMASSTSSFTWTTAQMYLTSRMTSVTNQVQYNAGGSLNPGQGVDVIAQAAVGTGNFPYTSMVTMKLKNGNKYTFQENGSLYLDAVSDARVDTYTNNNP